MSSIPDSSLELGSIEIEGIKLRARLRLPAAATILVMAGRPSAYLRDNPRCPVILDRLDAAGIATLDFDVFTEAETLCDLRTGTLSFDLDLISRRVLQVTAWAMQDARTRRLGIGYLGANIVAAGTLIAAAQLGTAVQAVVSRSGRLDFVGPALARVTAPALLLVAEPDRALQDINRQALDQLTGVKRLEVIPGASHLFEEPGALETLGELAARWFRLHVKAPQFSQNVACVDPRARETGKTERQETPNRPTPA